MQRVTATFVLTVLAVLAVVAPQVALAQADAGQAFTAGKTAYAQGQFDKARDSFIKASQTDNRNPEVFLWLGKAHYQLGELDKAVEAWSRTLHLAPEEPYAGRMLKVLRGQKVEADTSIRLVEVMVRERLFPTALRQCRKLLADKALTDAQRAGVSMLRAAALLETRNTADAIAVLHEITVRYASHADPAETTLLLGRAKIQMSGLDVADGLKLLKKVTADHAGTPSAATAEYELIRYGLGRKADAAGAKALAKWIGANAGHAKVKEARHRLVEVYLAVARKAGAPARDAADLNDAEKAALAVATDLYRQIVVTKEADALTRIMRGHLNGYYYPSAACPAAIAFAETLLKAPLPAANRLQILNDLGQYRCEYAIEQLNAMADAGKLTAREMPKVLADAAAVYAAINREFPAKPAWKRQAILAARVHAVSRGVPWPAKVTQPKAPHTWAVRIALPVVKANADSSAVRQAARMVANIVVECGRFHKPPARGMALAMHTELLEVLSEKHSAWPGAMFRQIQLLSAYATDVFRNNLKEGKADANARLTDHQKRLLAAMIKLIGRRSSHAGTVLGSLKSHFGLWVHHGHYALVEQAYAQLAAALPVAQKKLAQLAVAELWVGKVAKEHNRLLSAGLNVPRKLDPIHVKALEQCYALQAGLDEGDAFIRRVRSVRDGIVNHYKRLEYFDVAAQAVKVKSAAAVDAADAYAQLQLAHLHCARARRELAEFLKQYKAAKKITLTAAFRTAIADYEKFISDRPSSPLAGEAVGGIFSIARLFEQHQAYDVAAGVYRDFAAFAAKVKVLSQAAPGAASTAERAEFAVAGALYAKAQQALHKTTAEAKPQAPPPAKISGEFAAAVGAYKDFIKARPKSALLSPAIRRIMSAALEYARINSWDVADGIYADLLKADLAIRRPERIRFCRGLCQLGKVMPDHAKQVLSALSIIDRDVEKSYRSSDDLYAYLPATGPASDAEKEKSSPSATRRPAGSLRPAPGVYDGKADDGLKRSDMLAMVTIRKHQHRRAAQIAKLRDRSGRNYQPTARRSLRGRAQKGIAPAAPVLSDAEIARRQKAFAAAYDIFQAIRKDYARTPTASQARGEIMVMISHWRTIARWQRAAALAERFLADNPTDRDLPQLRLSIARDYLAWAAKPVEKQPSKQEMLAEVAGRFDKARARLAGIVKAFSEEKPVVHQAQWDIANSFLTQARVVDAFSPMLARGQYVRGARELQNVAVTYHDHPNIASVPQMLWNVSQELAGRGYHEEAMTVWNELTIHYPTHSLAQAASLRIAQTYRDNLGRPLRAAEAYLELNFARGGNDQNIQNAIFQIGSKLKNEKRWVEALHVLETFVDSFPRHSSAGRALTMVGQIHQANEAWEDAIAAYRRVIDEFPSGTWVRTAKWAIAECTINLSRWREAMSAYQTYLAAYPKDSQASEARRRIGVLKDLARYQALVDEKGQRKAFDAQYQIAEIVGSKLSNPVKAIIEYRKVAGRWPKSHLADDAMFKVGATYLAMGETTKAREALLAVATEYPNSPLADDALYMVGKSYEKEALNLAAVTRAGTLAKAKEIAQRRAYKMSQLYKSELHDWNEARIAELKKGGKSKLAAMEEARGAARQSQYSMANISLLASQAKQEVQVLTAKELADRQDKINAALRKAVGAYQKAAKVAAADKADESLLRMAVIYAEKLKDSDAAMKTYLEIVRQFSGTAVAEDASWRIAQYHERQGKFAEAIVAYKAFLRNYRRSARAGAAQFAVAENYEHLGKWVDAMDAYTNYINNFPSGPLVRKATEQINWIKTYRL